MSPSPHLLSILAPFGYIVHAHVVEGNSTSGFVFARFESATIDLFETTEVYWLLVLQCSIHLLMLIR